ncbi:MAG: hypothetical protein JRE21_02490 [Deltaproteobacteria bacterium]|nr:hypothetical protein [Deltaproteobacteria bacterium]
MDEATEVRQGEELDARKIGPFLRDVIPGLEGEMKIQQFPISILSRPDAGSAFPEIWFRGRHTGKSGPVYHGAIGALNVIRGQKETQ